MKLFRKIVDEREETEIMSVESGVYYLFLFALGIAIAVQAFIGRDLEHVAGELIVLFAGVCWVMAGYFRKGIWDYRTKPGIKTYLVYSIIFTLIYIALAVLRYFISKNIGIDLPTHLKYTAIRSLLFFSASFLILTLIGIATKRRREKLEREFDDENR